MTHERRRPTALTATATSSTKPAGTDRCHTADLTVTPGNRGGTAGTSYLNLVFTNRSPHSCTLYGYPGVSWVTGDNGAQVNNGFTRNPDQKKVTITIKSHREAHTSVALPRQVTTTPPPVSR